MSKKTGFIIFTTVVLTTIILSLIMATLYQVDLVPKNFENPAKLETNEKVTRSVDKNIQVYERSSRKSTESLEKLDIVFVGLSQEIGDFLDPRTNDIPSISKIKRYTNDIEALFSDISTAKNNLDDGPNSDTKNFRDLVYKKLEDAETLVEEYKKHAKYLTCVSSEIYNLSSRTPPKPFYSITLELDPTISNSYMEEKESRERLNKITPGFKTAISSSLAEAYKHSGYAESLDKCFFGDFEKYKNLEINNNSNSKVGTYLEYLTKNFRAFSGAVNTVSNAIKADDPILFRTGMSELLPIPTATIDGSFAKTVVTKPYEEFGKKFELLEKNNSEIKSQGNEIKTNLSK